MGIISDNKQSATHIPYLDGWRGIAIIMVLLAHFTSLGEKFNFLGEFGVTVFFVLSGFLMSRILFIQKVPLSTFFRRRIARILPVLWLYLTVVFLGGWIFFNEFHLKELLSSIIFLRTYYPEEISIAKSYVPIGHIWSLNVEEHCYLLLALLSVLAIKIGETFVRFALGVLALICVMFFVFYKFYPPEAQTVFGWRTEVAALPLLISCSVFLWLTKYPIKLPSFLPLLSFLGAFGIMAFSTSVFLSYIGISVFLGISINTLHLAPAWTLVLLSNAVIRWFGVCSYSIYLWQQIFFFCKRYTDNWPYYDLFSIASILLIASCSFYFFEKPVRSRLTHKPLKANTI
ncbi:MAG: acyltransferase [Methylomicrobium sp.]|nr:acyltransferase [Methylomicrobium sp.]